MYRTLVEAVLHHGETKPEKLAVAFKNVCLDYRTLCCQMQELAVWLKEQGVEKGDRVMLSAVSKPEYIVSLLAIQSLGAVSVPIDKSAKEENILDIYQFIAPRLLLTDSRVQDDSVKKCSLKELYARIAEKAVSREPDWKAYDVPGENDVIEMLFTTGTTGKPKGAMLTRKNIYTSIHNTWNGVGMRDTDRILLPLPLNHSVGMRVLRTALYTGASVVIQNGFTFAKELEKNIEQYACTALVSVPASIELVMRQMQEKFPEVLGKLRYIEFGAGSLSYEMKKKLVKLLPGTTIYNTWGSTETGGAIFLNVSERPDKLTSLGKPAEGIRLKVVNEQGEDITATAKDIDTAGRMALKGDMQMAGYYHLPEQTEATLVDGWLYTNDMVYTDGDGFVYMLGRADDIINVGGEKVSPIEVENIASEFKGIRESACIGTEDPDGILGQVPVLFIVPDGTGVDEKELTRFLSSRMEKYKLPHEIVTLDELPRNRMKKLDRKALKKWWQENGNLDVMNEVIKNILGRQSIREFEEKEIPKPYLEQIVRAGIQAPTSRNMQTWKFTVVRNREMIQKLKETVETVAKRHKVQVYGFQNPQALILVSNDRRNTDGIQDSACAAENMMLAANSYGLGAAWLNPLKTVCDETEIRELLDELEIPQKHIVWAMIALGYPAKRPQSPARKMNVVKWVE